VAEIAWSEPALGDLDAIADYIAIENPLAASALVKRVFGHIAQLEAHPESGSRPPELPRSRYRQIVEPPCRVFHRYDGHKVFIVYVMRSERLLRPRRRASRAKRAKVRPLIQRALSAPLISGAGRQPMRGLFILFALFAVHVAWAASTACPLTPQEQASEAGEDTCLQIAVHDEQKQLDTALLDLRRILSPRN
jgi:toxin ParE1/3/4